MPSSAEVMTCRVWQYIGVKTFVFTIWGIWLSKDAEFYVAFKNINLPYSDKMNLKK
jgi:hypothetical protein